MSRHISRRFTLLQNLSVFGSGRELTATKVAVESWAAEGQDGGVETGHQLGGDVVSGVPDAQGGRR
jgi:hypothetical protein